MEKRIAESQTDYEEYAFFDGAIVIRSKDKIVLRDTSYIEMGDTVYVTLWAEDAQ
jgi:DNA integrity scanning protein DisA with diadenylate cyclase activity